MTEKPPEEKRPEVEEPVTPPPKPEKVDYETLLRIIETCEPKAKKINSVRILETLGKLKSQVEEELKELVYQDYQKSKQ